jgi:hypothetical protein
LDFFEFFCSKTFLFDFSSKPFYSQLFCSDFIYRFPLNFCSEPFYFWFTKKFYIKLLFI